MNGSENIVKDIPIKDIKVVENVRVKDFEISYLMSSIKQNGLLQPIGLNKNNRVLYGHRRLQACEKLGWKSIPAIIYDLSNETDMLILNAVENIQRRDVTPIELGRMIIQLSKKLSPTEIQVRLSITKHKFDSAVDAYRNVPIAIRNKIQFFAHGKQRKEGKISASLALTATSMKRRYGFNNKQLIHLLEKARKDELTSFDISIISALVRGGMPLNKAIAQRKFFTAIRCDVVVNVKEVTELSKKNKVSPIEYLRGVIYGTYSPVSKPKFVNTGGLFGEDRTK